jgi:hypothetical protein
VRVTARGRRQLEASRTRRTAWLATQLHGVAPAELAALADALPVLERLTAVPGRDAP